MTDFECHVCGSRNFQEETVSEVFVIDGRRVLVERIPARVCERCGEPAISAETAERVRETVHSETRPQRRESLDVFVLT